VIQRWWAFEDRFGRAWRLSIGGTATDAPSNDDRAWHALDGLVYSYLHGSQLRGEYAAQSLFEIHNQLTGDSLSYRDWIEADLDSARFVSNKVAATLDRALRSGWLRVEAGHHQHYFPPVEDTAAQPFFGEDPPPSVELTFIEIELRDDNDDPVPDARYIIVTPGNDTREGKTNREGRAREDRLLPGTCSVSFPDFHGPEWSAS